MQVKSVAVGSNPDFRDRDDVRIKLNRVDSFLMNQNTLPAVSSQCFYNIYQFLLTVVLDHFVCRCFAFKIFDYAFIFKFDRLYCQGYSLTKIY